MRKIVKLGLILTSFAIILLAPGVFVLNGQYRDYPNHLVLLEKINSRRWNVPLVEIYPIPTAIGPSTQTAVVEATEITADQTGIQQISDWFKRSQKHLPYEFVNHTSHKFYKPFLIVNEKVCGSYSIDILIYIQSSPENYAKRRAIRETWGSRSVFTDINMRTVFILGRSGANHNQNEIQFLISNENLTYGDIVQLDFIDSFKNLTLKSIGTLRWIYQYCPQAKYIIKADDDIYVNIFLLVEKIISQIWQNNLALVCHYKKNGTSPIVRSPSSKWYVPNTIFKGYKYFPMGFCSGYAVLFTADLIPIMYKKSFEIPYTIIDDVYVFGLLLSNLSDVKFINSQRNFTLDQGSALKEYENKDSITRFVASSWAKDSMDRYWYATIKKLSEWAKQHSTLANSMGSVTT